MEMRRDKDGDTKMVDTTALLFSATSESLQTRDEIHIEWFTPDGTLINSHRIAGTNGEIEMDLALKPGDEATGAWKGNSRARMSKRPFAAGRRAPGCTQTNMLRSLLAKEDPIGAEASESDWLAVDPGRFTETRVKVLSAVDAKSYSVRESAANTSADLVVDRATGGVTRGIIQLGPTAITFDRVYVQGSP